jgi:hypothetical protein
VAIHIYAHNYIRMEITVIVFENFMASIGDYAYCHIIDKMTYAVISQNSKNIS